MSNYDPEPDEIDRLEAEAAAAKADAEAAKRLLAVVDAAPHLTKEQREAVAAVLTGEVDAAAITAKAEALYGKPAEPEPTPDPGVPPADAAALDRMTSVPAAAPPVPLAGDKVQDLLRRVSNPAVSARFIEGMRGEAILALKEAGVPFGSVEHNGTFQPL